jgi:acetyl-CoA synthetase
MSDAKLYPVPAEVAAHAWINNDQYLEMYKRSVDDPEGFWADQANQFVTWFKPWDKVLDWDFTKGYIRWFEGGKLNVSYNCLDRHLDSRGDQVAIIWEGDSPNEDKKITYRQLHTEVCKFANVMKSLGVGKGDRVCIYMPMIPETAVVMLACTRIGAVHSIVFGGFSPDSLKDRIIDAEAKLVVTSDEGLRGGRQVPMKANADKALLSTPSVQKMVVVKRTGGRVAWTEGRDVWYEELMAKASADCPPEHMDAEDPLVHPVHLRLYRQAQGRAAHHRRLSAPRRDTFTNTSSTITMATSTGAPPTSAGSPVTPTSSTARWPTAPPPSCSKASRPTPMPAGSGRSSTSTRSRIFYTAPTAIRSLMREGEGPVKVTSRKSLRLLGSPWASRSTRKPGSGTTAPSAAAAARSSTPGGRPKPAAS